MALESEAAIANMALAKIGNRAWIVDLDDATPEAETANKLYKNCRDMVLEIYAWPFAQRRSVLAALSGVAVSGWNAAYALPADCLAPREIYPGTRNPTPGQLIPFKTEYDGTKRILLTDEEEPELIYTAQVTDVAQFPPTFADVVACRLAAEMAAPVTGRPELRKEMMQQFISALNNAVTASAQEEEPDTEPDSEFITGRG